MHCIKEKVDATTKNDQNKHFLQTEFFLANFNPRNKDQIEVEPGLEQVTEPFSETELEQPTNTLEYYHLDRDRTRREIRPPLR